MSDLIDYAGLFPPAGLPMKDAVQNYARYLAGPDAWALARFIVPVSRFPEFESAFAYLDTPEPWAISALIGPDPGRELNEIEQFNKRNQWRAEVDTLELRVSSADEVISLSRSIPSSITAYFEFVPELASEILPAIASVGSRAKIRTGGLTADALPSSESVARFIMACANYKVPFKATAGLHHPLRCVRPLTYAPDAPTGTMHGFLNIFLAAIAATRSLPKLPDPERNRLQMLKMILDCPNPELRFTDEMASISAAGEPGQIPANSGSVGDPRHPFGVAGIETPISHIRQVRQTFAISFGSCSFEEPLSDLRELKLL